MPKHRNPLDGNGLKERLEVDFALKAARLGVWELDPISTQINWDARCQELFGLVSNQSLTYEAVLSLIHMDDRAQVDQAIRWAMNAESEGQFDSTFRTIGADDGMLRWVRFMGQGYFNKSGTIFRFSGVAQDVTAQKKGEERYKLTTDLLQSVFDSSTDGISVLKSVRNAQGEIIDFLYRLVNRVTEQTNNRRDLVGQYYSVVHPGYKQAGLFDSLTKVVSTGQSQQITFHYQHEGHKNWYKATAVKLDDGVVLSIQDITQDVKARQQLEASEARFSNLIREAPVATVLLVGPDLIIESPNEAILSIWGRDLSVLGKPLTEAVPEMTEPPFLTILQKVYTTGIAYHANEAPGYLYVDGAKVTAYFNFTYKPLLNANNEVYAILVMGIDVTEQVIARKKVEENEARFRLLIEQAPVATCLFVGRELRVEIANAMMIGHWGKGNSIVGKTLTEILPELKNQPFLNILDDVFTTGQSYEAQAARADLEVDGVLGTYYFDFTYKPLRNASGAVYAIMAMSINVTEQVLAREKIKETEESLRGALELAELGTWTIDPIAGTITYDDRMKEWIGIRSNDEEFHKAMKAIPESDRKRIQQALVWALQAESGGIYNQEHPIENIRTGRRRIIHAQAKTFFDATGKAYKLVGAAQDITEQRIIQLVLEQQVQERTEELEATNEELAATNEELGAANDELAESNQLLIRSNQNLQQFAYIASHDLQEPLRKIQQFGDLLQSQYAVQLNEGINYLERIQAAASRMSTLIRDLLTFSRISTQQDTTGSVSLSKVIQMVLVDLDLRIQETNATIDISDSLPTVQGDKTQLGQLFMNLLSNALKFRRVDVTPHIRIRSSKLSATDLPLSVTPTRQAPFYYRIDVTDNGIGFDEKYLDRIFQVFQRLHSKHQYAGTGIGLAICEKVVANHGGAITARSKAGQGATFSVFLPV